MRKKSSAILFVLGCSIVIAIIAATLVINPKSKSKLPLVAIANYGPHASLDASIVGIKQELARQGFVEGKTVRYQIADVGFDSALIPQMIINLSNAQPEVIVVISTPVAQFAKHAIKDIPLVFTAITDPVAAGLLKDPFSADMNISGSSDRQDLRVMLQFAKKLMPNAKRVGMLYATFEANDSALLNMMQQATRTEQLHLLSIPVEQSRDVALRVQGFKDQVDLIYVGMSAIQPTLPAISAASAKMGIAVFNADEDSVKQGIALASCGVDYITVGANAGKLVAKVLNGTAINTLAPIYPSANDHHAFINKTKAKELGMEIAPELLSNSTIVE